MKKLSIYSVLIATLVLTGCASKETADLKTRLNQKNVIIKEYEAENRALAQENALCRKEKAGMKARVDFLTQVNARKDAALEDLAKSLKAGLGGGTWTTDPDTGALVGDSDVLFAPGSATLTKKGRASIKELAGKFKASKSHYKVVGHTDSTPLKRTKKKWSDNFGLSSARSLAVLRSLEKNGVASKQLSFGGHGQYLPVADNKSKTGRKKNRRVEIYILGAK